MMRIADRWFDIKKIDSRISLLTEPHVCRLEQCNIWHVRGQHHDLIVDFGLGVANLKEAMEALLDKPVLAVATHSHLDHIGSLHQFEHRCIHPLERHHIEHPKDYSELLTRNWPAEVCEAIRAQGYEVPAVLIDALPYEGFDIEAFRIPACSPTQLLHEGDILDLGISTFEVLHLPGHSPGSIGLWEARSGTLFSGDAIYDGPLLDAIPDASIPDYLKTMTRLRQLHVEIVHAGHDPSFGRDKLRALADHYILTRHG